MKIQTLSVAASATASPGSTPMARRDSAHSARPKIGNLVERFWARVHFEPNSGCWLWDGANVRGYGQLARSSGSRLATHISLEIAGRPVPRGKCVCHRCDMPSCVNPDHLFVGTDKDNSDDKRRKGRAVLPRPMPGSVHPSAVLSEAVVRMVKADLARGTQQKAIAASLGVSKSLINRIAVGKAWRHV